MDYASGFFCAVEHELDQHAKAIRNRLFALYHDMPWTSEHYHQLEPVVRDELEQFVRSILKICDNVGASKVPENVLGYLIGAVPLIEGDQDELEAGETIDICQDERDYAEMWVEFLELRPTTPSTLAVSGESST